MLDDTRKRDGERNIEMARDRWGKCVKGREEDHPQLNSYHSTVDQSVLLPDKN